MAKNYRTRKIIRICRYCGQEFVTFFNSSKFVCSPECLDKHLNEKYKDAKPRKNITLPILIQKKLEKIKDE